MYKNFDEVVAAVKLKETERSVAIAGAHDAPVIEAALRAEQQDIAVPIFVGNAGRIREILRSAYIGSFTLAGVELQRSAFWP